MPGTGVYTSQGFETIRYLLEVENVTEIPNPEPGQPPTYKIDWRVHAFEPPAGVPDTPLLEAVPRGSQFDAPVDLKITAGGFTSPEMGAVIRGSWKREVTFEIEDLLTGQTNNTYSVILEGENPAPLIIPAETFDDMFAIDPGGKARAQVVARARLFNEMGYGRYSGDSVAVIVGSG
ncbi:MAG TPA: hypothetical protein VK054_13645 [Beutenbergiaceae bacterium]|nr:hypothetical protein [Beutenbergiaceae bacterium]